MYIDIYEEGYRNIQLYIYIYIYKNIEIEKKYLDEIRKWKPGTAEQVGRGNSKAFMEKEEDENSWEEVRGNKGNGGRGLVGEWKRRERGENGIMGRKREWERENRKTCKGEKNWAAEIFWEEKIAEIEPSSFERKKSLERVTSNEVLET